MSDPKDWWVGKTVEMKGMPGRWLVVGKSSDGVGHYFGWDMEPADVEAQAAVDDVEQEHESVPPPIPAVPECLCGVDAKSHGFWCPLAEVKP